MTGGFRVRSVMFLGLCALCVSAPVAHAQDSQQSESAYDRIWRFAEWYEDGTNPVVQQVLFSGRYHQDFAAVSADQGDSNEWNVRRLRLGPRIRLFRTLTFHAEVELNPQERDPFYVRVTDFYVQWARNPQLVLTLGKQSLPFTIDGATSSRELLAIDRSNLSNNLWFPQEYLPGVSVSGSRSGWGYRVGSYSAGDANRELGEFNGGVVFLGTLNHALPLGDRAVLAGNYVYQTSDPQNTFTRAMKHIGSINLSLERGRWGLRTDLSGGAGHEGEGDIWGLMAMPFYNVTDRFQLVTRYTFLDGSGESAVRLATYESRVASARGDVYNELYLGGNYYFYGHRLKLQSGLQIADLNDHDVADGGYSGIAWVTGLRVGW
ncbi:MAG: porin [Vicinamibacterales bacterium]